MGKTYRMRGARDNHQFGAVMLPPKKYSSMAVSQKDSWFRYRPAKIGFFVQFCYSSGSKDAFKKVFGTSEIWNYCRIDNDCFTGRSAAWLARLPWEQEVDGSNPFAPIKTYT